MSNDSRFVRLIFGLRAVKFIVVFVESSYKLHLKEAFYG